MIFNSIPYIPGEEKSNDTRLTKETAYRGVPLDESDSVFSDEAKYLTAAICSDFVNTLSITDKGARKNKQLEVFDKVSPKLIFNDALLTGVLRNLDELAQFNSETERLTDTIKERLKVSLEMVAGTAPLDKYPLKQDQAFNLLRKITVGPPDDKYNKAILKGLLSREPVQKEKFSLYAVDTAYTLALSAMDNGDANEIAYVVNILCGNSDITIGSSEDRFRLGLAHGFISKDDSTFRKYADVDLFCDTYASIYAPDTRSDWLQRRLKANTRMFDKDPAYKYISGELANRLGLLERERILASMHALAIAEDKLPTNDEITTLADFAGRQDVLSITAKLEPSFRKEVLRRLDQLALFYGSEAKTTYVDIQHPDKFPYNILNAKEGSLRALIYADYSRRKGRVGSDPRVVVSLPGNDHTDIHTPDKTASPKDLFSYYKDLVLDAAQKQEPGTVLTPSQIATCINWLAPRELPSAENLAAAKDLFAERLRIDFRRSISPRGIRCVLDDASLRDLGYVSIIYKFNGANKREYVVDVNVGNCLIRVLLDKDKRLVDFTSRKSLAKYGAFDVNTTWFELMVLGHLSEIICSETVDLSTPYGKKLTQEEEAETTDARFEFSRAGHLRQIGIGEHAHEKQYVLAEGEQGWDLRAINAARRERGLPEVTYVKISDNITPSRNTKPVVYHSKLKLDELV